MDHTKTPRVNSGARFSVVLRKRTCRRGCNNDRWNILVVIQCSKLITLMVPSLWMFFDRHHNLVSLHGISVSINMLHLT